MPAELSWSHESLDFHGPCELWRFDGCDTAPAPFGAEGLGIWFVMIHGKKNKIKPETIRNLAKSSGCSDDLANSAEILEEFSSGFLGILRWSFDVLAQGHSPALGHCDHCAFVGFSGFSGFRERFFNPSTNGDPVEWWQVQKAKEDTNRSQNVVPNISKVPKPRSLSSQVSQVSQMTKIWAKQEPSYPSCRPYSSAFHPFTWWTTAIRQHCEHCAPQIAARKHALWQLSFAPLHFALFTNQRSTLMR